MLSIPTVTCTQFACRLPVLCLVATCQGASGDRFLAFTQSSFSGLGLVRTHLLLTSNLDVAALQTAHVGEYLNIAAQTSGGLQVRFDWMQASRRVRVSGLTVALLQLPVAALGAPLPVYCCPNITQSYRFVNLPNLVDCR